MSSPNLCACGCGQLTKRYNQSRPKRGIIRGEYARFLHGHNGRGASGPNWNGGRAVNGQGYVMRRISQGVYRYEHRLVMEQHLGRWLTPAEIVHHIDGDKQNNAIENLQVVTRAEHVRIHRKGVCA